MADFFKEEELNQMPDEDVVALYQSGKLSMETYLIHRFYPLVLRCSRHLFLTGGEQEDLYQEGTVGLFFALKRFDAARKVKFSTFASACILDCQLKAIEASNRKKHLPLNSYISIYETDGEHGALIDTLEAGEYEDPEKLYLAVESYQDMMEKVSSVLSPLENQVLDAYVEGMDYKTIAKKLGREEKSIDNAIQRIRSKVKRL